MKSIELFKKQINNPTLVFPQIISDSKIMKQFDRALVNRSPYVISILYKQYANDESIKLVEERINSGIKEVRNLSQDNKDLIKNIVEAYKQTNSKYVIFNSIGNLMFIADVIDHLKKDEETPEVIRVTCLLWLYQNIFELTISHLSEIFYIIAKYNRDSQFINLFSDALHKEEHLMTGQLLSFAKKTEYRLTFDGKDTLLHNNELRNRLAHANCFYDSVRKEIILSSDRNLTIGNFKTEFSIVKDFLFELIFRLNNEKDIEFTKEMISMARTYFKLSRNSQAVKFFKTEMKL